MPSSSPFCTGELREAGPITWTCMAGICHLGRVRCILFFGLRLRWKKVDDWVWWMDFCGRSNLNSGIPLTENPKPLQGFIHSKALRCVFTTRPRKSSQHDSGIVTAWGRCDYGFHFATNTKFGSLMSQPRMISGEELFFFGGGRKAFRKKWHDRKGIWRWWMNMTSIILLFFSCQKQNHLEIRPWLRPYYLG